VDKILIPKDWQNGSGSFIPATPYGILLMIEILAANRKPTPNIQ